MVAAVFVSNLIKRHPNCKVLLHRRESDHTSNTDTFDLSEPDPAKSGALESSLWELKVSLKSVLYFMHVLLNCVIAAIFHCLSMCSHFHFLLHPNNYYH